MSRLIAWLRMPGQRGGTKVPQTADYRQDDCPAPPLFEAANLGMVRAAGCFHSPRNPAIQLTSIERPMSEAPDVPKTALPDFARNAVNLASAGLGAKALFATDDFFADVSRMLADAPAVFIADK